MDDGDVVPEVDTSTFQSYLSRHPFDGPELYRMDERDGPEDEGVGLTRHDPAPWLRVEMDGGSREVHVDTPPNTSRSASEIMQSVLPPIRAKVQAMPVAQAPPMKAPVTTPKAGGAASAAPPVGDRRTGRVHIIGGDLMTASEDFIVHQCSCTISGNAGGIVATVFKRFSDVDVYKIRKVMVALLKPMGPSQSMVGL